MAQLGIRLNLDVLVSTLSPAERAFLGIVRAMRIAERPQSDQLFILDEPTAALSKLEADKLLELMRRVADMGSAVVFISHRLSEVFAICDRVTIMRNGRDVAHLRTANAFRAELVNLMLGKKLGELFPSPPNCGSQPPRLTTLDLSGQTLNGVNIEIRGGEVVGVTGLAGMGQQELPQLLFGARKPSSGSYALDGRSVSFASPKQAIDAGVALVPRNRLTDGIWSSGTAEENLSLPILGQHFGMGWLSNHRMEREARRKIESASVHPLRIDYPMAAFSGGNQQKIVLSKWLQLQPRLLLLDEPIHAANRTGGNLVDCCEDRSRFSGARGSGGCARGPAAGDGRLHNGGREWL